MSQVIQFPSSHSEPIKNTNGEQVKNLAQMWAKKYIQNVSKHSNVTPLRTGTQQIADRLHSLLRTTSVQAWSQTEAFISQEIERHGINHQLIDPWQISQDSFVVFDKTIEIYSKQEAPQQVARELGLYISTIRAHYTANDPRAIGFVSLQFHYTGQLLLRHVPEWEKERLNAYFKVIDDHLYMPLQRAYNAAANYDYQSPELELVRHLLPLSSQIAEKVCDRVIQIYPNYASYSGLLSNPVVKIASIRDTEMFQVYLWVCMLERSISSLQEELFPLCLMLYPTLKVNWELVRQMIHLLGNSICNQVDEEKHHLFKPYLQVLWEIFSPEIFADTL